MLCAPPAFAERLLHRLLGIITHRYEETASAASGASHASRNAISRSRSIGARAMAYPVWFLLVGITLLIHSNLARGPAEKGLPVQGLVDPGTRV